jgi:tetratricopeptide (TPR) repeat protein
MASNLAWGEWEWEESGISYQRAIELNPNYADARVFYSHYLIIMNRPDEGMAQIEKALELDPFNPMAQGFHGMALIFLRRYDDAIAVFQNVLKTEPTHGVAIANLYMPLALTQRYEEALEILKVLHQMIGLPQGEAVITKGYEEGGFVGAMTKIAEMWEEVFRASYFSPGMIAEIYTFAGDKEKVFEWLDKGFELQDPNIPYIGVSPSHIDLLKDEPHYHELLRKMNLPLLK